MNSKFRGFLGILLILFYYRGPIVDYGTVLVDNLTKVSAVVNIPTPDEETLEIVKESKIEDFNYSDFDRVKLAIFFNEFSQNVKKIQEGAANQEVFEHLVDSFNEYGSLVSFEKRYEGFTESIKNLFKIAISPDGNYKILKKEEIDELSEISKAVAWVISNG